MGCELPDKTNVTSLLSDLIGKDTTSAAGKAPKPGAAGVVATYSSDDGELAAAVVCSMELAASLGAALTLIPAATAAKEAAAGSLDDTVWENLSEVVNVASRWFNASGGTHVRLRGMSYIKDVSDDDAKGLLAKPASRLDLDVTVKGYGAGLISLLVR